MGKQEGAWGTERWNRSEREREGATLVPLFLHHSSERFHRSVLPWSSLVFPGLSWSFPGLPWSFLVFPRSFFFFPLYLFRYS